MAERFQRLYALEPNLYSEGCPIIIEAGALLKDTESGSVLAQIKMRNIGEQVISSCRVSIKAYATNGDEVEGFSDFSYLDLNANRGREFGSKTPVMLPDRTARKFTVDINEIVFSDGSVKKMDDNQWSSVPKQKSLAATFQSEELAQQYATEVGGSAEFMPEKWNGLFLCACGAINLDSTGTCYKCGNTYERLNGCLDRDYLSSKVEERKNKEWADKARRQALIKKYAKIAALVIVAIVAITSISSIIKKAEAKKARQEIAELTADVVSSKMAKEYTSTDTGQTKTLTFEDDMVWMKRYDSFGDVEYSSGFYYEVRKMDNGQYELALLYPKSKTCGEYLINGMEGDRITELKCTTKKSNWAWDGTYKIE